MSWILRIFLFGIKALLQKQVMQEVRKKGLLLYLKVLQVTRRSLVAAVLLFLVLQMMVLGLLGVIVCSVFLLPQELETKLWILFSIFSFCFLIPLLIFSYALSESAWLKYSGAKDLIVTSESPIKDEDSSAA